MYKSPVPTPNTPVPSPQPKWLFVHCRTSPCISPQSPPLTPQSMYKSPVPTPNTPVPSPQPKWLFVHCRTSPRISPQSPPLTPQSPVPNLNGWLIKPTQLFWAQVSRFGGRKWAGDPSPDIESWPQWFVLPNLFNLWHHFFSIGPVFWRASAFWNIVEGLPLFAAVPLWDAGQAPFWKCTQCQLFLYRKNWSKSFWVMLLHRRCHVFACLSHKFFLFGVSLLPLRLQLDYSISLASWHLVRHGSRCLRLSIRFEKYRHMAWAQYLKTKVCVFCASCAISTFSLTLPTLPLQNVFMDLKLSCCLRTATEVW